MKLTSLILLFLLHGYVASAQLTITPGAHFSIIGNIRLSLQNADLINHGIFTTGNSTVSFNGNTSSSISGSQPIQFFEIEIHKANNSSVLLARSIGVSQRIRFTSGFLNLNGFNTDLGTTGRLEGEQGNSRIIGPNGGEVIFNVNLNSPTNSNPANLGLFISSVQNLGNTIIKRGHRSQVNGSGLGNSILRYYDIIPSNNTNLNATLRFRYLDEELNGFNENSLAFFSSQNTINWVNIGFNSKDGVANFAEKNGISNFGRFTLSSAGNVLPVRFTSFTAKCEGNKTLISWKTAHEQNSHHFDIERSVDGSNWTVIDHLPAAGNSMMERNYSTTDNNPLQNSFYRIAEYDLDGNVRYSDILRSSCVATDEVLTLWPNPVHDKLSVTIVTNNTSQAVIKVFDSKGALVKLQKTTILQGSNQLSVDMNTLANGIYSLSADWNNGQTKKTVQVLKK